MYSTSGSRSVVLVVAVIAISASLFLAMTYDILPSFPGNETLTTTTTTNTLDPPDSYVLHNPIEIRNDTELSIQASEEGWLGDGSDENPYLIKGYEIEATGSCIWIEQVTSHFIISHCKLSGVTEWGSDWGNAGIVLTNSANGKILNCVFDVELLGLRMYQSTAMHIESCSFSLAQVGANVSECSHSTFLFNLFGNNSIPMGFFMCDSINVQENDIYGGQMTLGFYGCTDILFHGNVYFANYDEIYFGSVGGAITDNIFAYNYATALRLGYQTSGVQVIANLIGFNALVDAIDNGQENSWDDSSATGNYWSDFEGEGTFTVPGAAGSVDHYPQTLTQEDLPPDFYL
jgi:hypothetical protein